MDSPLDVQYRGEDVLDALLKEGEFASLVVDGFGLMCRRARLVPEFSPRLLHDAWKSFCWDVERLDGNMPSKPDHYKICGFAAYWLRRNSPVIGLKEDGDDADLSESATEWRDFFGKYDRAFLAFAFGFRICYIIETRRKKGGGDFPQEPDMDYIKTICYMMKYKNISPHAMGMIYRSLFVGNRTPRFS